MESQYCKWFLEVFFLFPIFFSSWCFQPIWKICSSNWIHLPQLFGMKIRCHHHLPVFCFWIPVFSSNRQNKHLPTSGTICSLKLTANAPENRPKRPKRKRSWKYSNYIHWLRENVPSQPPSPPPKKKNPETNLSHLPKLPTKKKSSKILGLPNSHVASIVYRCSSYRPRCPGNPDPAAMCFDPIRQGRQRANYPRGLGGLNLKKCGIFEL